MQPDDLVSVYTVKNVNVAELIKNFLALYEIDSRLGNAGQAELKGLLDVHVLVRRVNADVASRLIRSTLDVCESDQEYERWQSRARRRRRRGFDDPFRPLD